MNKDQRIYLHDILERITRIETNAVADLPTLCAAIESLLASLPPDSDDA